VAYGSNCIKEVRRGYRYILTLVDSMSKLGFAFPTRSQSVGEIISILETNVLPIVNVPRELVTDAAQVFRSKLFEGFCLDNNIDHLEGVPTTRQIMDWWKDFIIQLRIVFEHVWHLPMELMIGLQLFLMW